MDSDFQASKHEKQERGAQIKSIQNRDQGFTNGKMHHTHTHTQYIQWENHKFGLLGLFP